MSQIIAVVVILGGLFLSIKTPQRATEEINRRGR